MNSALVRDRMEAGRLTALLEALRAAFLEKGCDVDRYLRPGLAPEVVRERTSTLPFSLPTTIVELFGWRDGQGDDAEHRLDSLHFRDNAFISLEQALLEYERLQDASRQWPSERDLLPLGFEPEHAFPVAAYAGDAYAVVRGPHRLATSSPHPVVSFFQGVHLYFHSLPSMVATCIDWVREPRWTPGALLGMADDVELEIWRRRNPGLPADAVAQPPSPPCE